MKKLSVLIACEESQIVCKAFRALGHEAYSCDVKDCSGGRPEWHLKCDALDALQTRTWDLVIAHPPCTYLADSGARWMYPVKGCEPDPRRLFKMRLARDFFQEFLDTPFARHVAIENPTPLTIAKLPKCSQVIEPWMFGDNYTKRTCLWLKGLPNLVPSVSVKPDGVQPYINVGSTTKTPWKRGCCSRRNCQVMRSRTFHGIAAAMANQWSDFIGSQSKV